MKVERLTRVIEKEVVVVREEIIDYYQVELTQEQLNMIYCMSIRVGESPKTSNRKYSDELTDLLQPHVTNRSMISTGTLRASDL